jgi:hypothetical protein
VAPAFQPREVPSLAGLAGAYKGIATSSQGQEEITAELRVVDGRLTGTLISSDGPIAITGATLTGDRVVLDVDMGGASNREHQKRGPR